MDLEQKTYIETHYIASRGKVFRIGELAKADVPDPYRGAIDTFRASLQVIEEGVEFWAKYIPQMG
jgi:protein-tyrosine phosphatase